jgi:hypothetical protein
VALYTGATVCGAQNRSRNATASLTAEPKMLFNSGFPARTLC